jgi:hypothetical protein
LIRYIVDEWSFKLIEMDTKGVKKIKINTAVAKPIVEAMEKKQDHKNKVMSGEIKVKISKGDRFA